MAVIEPLQPITIRLPSGELRHLNPGEPVELAEPLAQRLLLKAPGRVRVVPEAATAPAVPNSHDLGRVVLIPDGAGRTRREISGVIVDVFQMSGRPPLKDGVWYEVMADGRRHFIHPSHVLGWDLRCHTCKQSRWWWTPTVIRCGRCHPPVPDWLRAWREVAALTDGITDRDPRFDAVLAEMAAADAAFAADNYPAFQRAELRIRWVATSPEALR